MVKWELRTRERRGAKLRQRSQLLEGLGRQRRVGRMQGKQPRLLRWCGGSVGRGRATPKGSCKEGGDSPPLRLCCLPLSMLSSGRNKFTISDAHHFCCPECRRAITLRLRLFLPLGQLQQFLFKGLRQQSQGKKLLNPHNLLNLLFWTRKTFHP